VQTKSPIVGAEPEQFSRRRRIPRLPLIVVALLVGSVGTYALINSFASTQNSNCFAVPSACGYPDATNTGVPAGTTLTPSGSITASTPGQVIDGKDVSGTITIAANNVTVQNTRVTLNSGSCGTTNACGNYEIKVNDGVTGAVIKNVELRAAAGITCEHDIRNVGGTVQVISSYLHGCDSNLYSVNNTTFTDVYGLSKIDISTDHVENIYFSDSTVTVNHSTLFNPVDQTAVVFGNVNGGSGGTCTNHLTVSNSLFAGGGFTLYPCGNGTSAGSSSASITNTHFARCLTTPVYHSNGGNTTCQGGPDSHGYYPYGGNYGIGSYYFSNATTWSGNVWDDNLQAICFDGNPGCGTSGTPTPPDTTPPAVSLTAPTNGSTVSGSSVTVSASASDNVGVAGVQFKLDGNNLGSEDTSNPYSTTWNTTSASNGTHTLTAVARDAAGNTKTSSSVTVTVNNTMSGGGTQTKNCFSKPSACGYPDATNTGVPAGTTLTPSGSITASTNGQVIDGKDVTGQIVVNAPNVTIKNSKVHTSSGGSGETAIILNNGATNFTLQDSEVYGNGSKTNAPESGVWNHYNNSGAKVIRSYIHGSPDNWEGRVDLVQDSYMIVDAEYSGAHSENIYICGTSATVDHSTLYNQSDETSLIFGDGICGAGNPVSVTNSLLAGGGWMLQPDSKGVSAPVTITNNRVGRCLTTVSQDSGGGYVCKSGADAAGFWPYGGHYGLATDLGNSLTWSGNVWDDNSQTICPSQDGGGTCSGGTTTPPDTTKPTVNFTAPAANATVSGVVTTTAAASDNVGVTKVEISLDGALKMTDPTAPYNYSFDSKALSNGAHTLTAKAYDAAGNTNTASVTFNVSNTDTTPPTTPTGLSATAATATSVKLSWNASTDSGSGVSKYNVLRNGVVIAQPTGTSYTDNTVVANTAYSYTVQAVDGAGNVSANSNTATVTTPTPPDTTPPTTPANLHAAAPSSSQVTLTWSASTDTGGSGLAGYNIYRGSTKLNSALVTTTSYGDGTVLAETTYSYKIEAVDGAGNKSPQTAAVSITTPAPPDTTAPAVSLTAPSSGSSVSGSSVTVSATASDNVGVVGVQFKLDGNNLGSEDTASPYTTTWNTTTTGNGTHTLTAIARDAAGNTKTATSVTVTVNNSTSGGQACTTTLSVGANVQNALASAAPGAVICLNGGTWSAQTFSGIAPSGTVTLQPTPGATVHIKGITLNGPGNTKNLTVQGFYIDGGVSGLCGIDGNVIFQHNTIQHINAGNAFYFYANGCGGSHVQTGVSMLHNQMDHVGECLTVAGGAGIEKNFTFKDNVCGPDIGAGVTRGNQYSHYIEIGCMAGGIFDNNAFLGPYDATALSNSDPATAVHNNVFHCFGDGSNISFSNNILWHTQSRAQTVLFQSGKLDNITIHNNLFVNDPFCHNTANNCPAQDIEVYATHGLTVTNNTVVATAWGLHFPSVCTDGCYASGTNNTLTNNIVEANATDGNADYAEWGSCTSGCVTGQNVSYDTSAVGSPSVKNWTPSYSNTSWTPHDGEPYSAPPAGYYAATGLPFTAGWNGSGGPQGGVGAAAFNGGSGGTTTPPPDTTKPTVSFASPASGSTVSGIVTAAANASDDTGVTKVELSLDGSLKMTDSSAPYNYSFDSKTLSNGSHTLSAKAYDAAGNTNTASVSFIVNNADITPPTVPANVKATATKATNVDITWDASTDSGTGATGVAKYSVLRNGVVIAQVTGTSYSDTTVVANTSYSYIVQAIDGAGNVSANSSAATVTTPTAPDTTPPTAPTSLSAKTVNANQINLTWKASTDTGGSGIAGYNVYRNGLKINTALVTTAAYGDATLLADTTYTYKVKAVDGAGNVSADSNSVSAKTAPSPDTTKPHKPGHVHVKAESATSVTVTWRRSTDDSDGSGIAGYNVYRNGTKLNQALISATSYTDTTVKAKTTYRYRLEAVDKAGNKSGKTQAVSVTTPKAVSHTSSGGTGGTSQTPPTSTTNGGTPTPSQPSPTPSGSSNQPNQPPTGSNIVVTVRGPQNRPIWGATVTLNGHTVRTDSSGNARFNFDSLTPGKYTLAANYNGKHVSQPVEVLGASQSSQAFQVDLNKNKFNTALLLIPLAVLIAAGVYFARPWQRLDRATVAEAPNRVVTSDHPHAQSVAPHTHDQAPRSVYEPHDSDQSPKQS
jgi:fibronectin type 3 domain-containing protein